MRTAKSLNGLNSTLSIPVYASTKISCPPVSCSKLISLVAIPPNGPSWVGNIMEFSMHRKRHSVKLSIPLALYGQVRMLTVTGLAQTIITTLFPMTSLIPLFQFNLTAHVLLWTSKRNMSNGVSEDNPLHKIGIPIMVQS